MPRKPVSPETRARLSEARRKWWAERTPEERRNHNGLLGKRLTDEERQKIRDGIQRSRRRRESVRNRGRKGGLISGADRARRCAEDPEYRSFISATVRASITDEQRARSSAQMLAMQKVRWRCECGMESTPGGIGRHMKAAGHTTKRRI